jgi:hypothetical protein
MGTFQKQTWSNAGSKSLNKIKQAGTFYKKKIKKQTIWKRYVCVLLFMNHLGIYELPERDDVNVLAQLHLCEGLMV